MGQPSTSALKDRSTAVYIPALATRTACEYLILGPLEVRVGGETVALGGPRQRALLAALLLAGGAPVSRDRLVEDVWGEQAPASAQHAVQVYVSRLRERLGAAALYTGAGPVYAVAGERDQVDAHRFEALAAAARARLKQEPEAAAAQLAAALGLWRGAVLADLSYDGAGRTEIARLEELRLTAIEDRLEAELALGHHRERIPELEALVAAEPLRERARGQLMLALYRAGRQADALAAYREGRRHLIDELGLEPGGQLRALEQAILRQDPAIEDPRLRRRRNLPAPATALVGRETELAELGELLGGTARLVTLTGPGGSGKTRLAIGVADALGPRFADGTHFVDLSALRDPRLVGGTIAAALQLDEDTFADQIKDRHLLLVLDNFEQVDDAAPVVGRLLAAAPGLKVIATSRIRLDLYGEHEYPVAPLAPAEGADLFVARARARRRGFEPTAAVTEIVRRVEGLPLAIELVAARVGELDLEDMVAGLPVLDLAARGPRDAPERHRALRATIDWSHDLLDDDERTLFARAGVFAGGFDPDAAAAVGGASPARLDALVAHSLLRRHDERRTMLETIRERALEHLDASGEGDAVRRRHAEHFAAFAETSEDELKGPDQQAWGERVECDHDNLRAALAFSLGGGGDRVVGLRLAAALGWFWYTHGHGTEGVRRLEQAVAAAPPEAPALLRGRVTHVLGVLLSQRADLERADARFRAGLALFREAGDEQRAAGSLNSLAANARLRGALDESRQLFEQAIAMRRTIGDRKRLADPLSNLGVVLMDVGDLDGARERFEQSLEIDREFANEWGIALNLGNLGAVGLERGDPAQARPLLTDALRRLRALGDRSSILQGLDRAAALAAAEGEAIRAGRLAGASAANRVAMGEPLPDIEVAIVERHLAAAREHPGFAAAYVDGGRLSLDAALDEALDET
jgi:predicted ATPase/DNA-binding SARP family transcriptional activator